MDKFLNALIGFLITSPVWLIVVILLFIEGHLILLLIYGFEMKKIKKIHEIIMPLSIGIGVTGLFFLFQNFTTIIESKMTLELMESNLLSSVILSFAIVGIISVIILPIKETKRLKNKRGGKK